MKELENHLGILTSSTEMLARQVKGDQDPILARVPAQAVANWYRQNLEFGLLNIADPVTLSVTRVKKHEFGFINSRRGPIQCEAGSCLFALTAPVLGRNARLEYWLGVIKSGDGFADPLLTVSRVGEKAVDLPTRPATSEDLLAFCNFVGSAQVIEPESAEDVGSKPMSDAIKGRVSRFGEILARIGNAVFPSLPSIDKSQLTDEDYKRAMLVTLCSQALPSPGHNPYNTWVNLVGAMGNLQSPEQSAENSPELSQKE